MKRILIATDFSPASDRAVEYGLKLGAALDAAVTIVAAYEDVPVPVTDMASFTFIDGAGVREAVEQGLWRQRNRYRQSEVQPIETLPVRGAVVESILETIEELSADLVVMGMKGKGKSVRKLFGSTVTGLARKTRVPLLVVPEEARYMSPANILLGNDVRPDTDLQVLDPLKELVAIFGARVYALRVIQNGTKEYLEVMHNPSPLQPVAKEWELKYEYEMGGDVVAVLNEFARTHHIDMVVMVPHPHFLPERWFIRSRTREMIFEAKIPLLILPE